MALAEHKLVLDKDNSIIRFSTHQLIRILNRRHNYFLPTLSNDIIYMNLNNSVLLVAENTELNNELFITNTPVYDASKIYFLHFNTNTELQTKISALGYSKILTTPLSSTLVDINIVLSNELNCFLYDITEVGYIDLNTEQHIKGNKIFENMKLLTTDYANNGQILFLDDDYQIKPYEKKTNELASSFFVKLSSDIIANGKIIFDFVFLNTNNIFQNSDLFVDTGGLYTISGVICVYSIKNSILPMDVILSITLDDVPIIKLANTVKKTSDLNNISFNFSMKLNSSNKISLHLDPNEFIYVSSEYSYFNCALVNIY